MLTGIAGALGACGGDASDPVLTESGYDAAGCMRNPEGQITCLRQAFELTGCLNLKPIDSMHKDAQHDFAHLTAFDASDACLSEMVEAAEVRGFVERKPGEFFKDFGDGYSELLNVSDNGTLQWEREQQ